MFDSTQPVESADLMRVSAFRRYLVTQVRDTEAAGLGTRLTSLNPSLLQDLMRFERPASAGEPPRLEALEVLAAALRHGRRLRVHLEHESRVLPLTVFPNEGQVHCPLPMPQFLALRLVDLRVLHVEPAELEPLARHGNSADAEAQRYGSLGLLLWELALRGSREALLPELAGAAAYRVAPSANLASLSLSGSVAAAVGRLPRDTTNLAEIASWPGFDRSRAMRMLNGLYLQAALMVSRSHPAATNEHWQANKS